MRFIILLLFSIFIPDLVIAQSPSTMSYQAILRDNGNGLVINQGVGAKVSILQGSASGNAVYEELHATTTNANGLLTLEVGTGSVVSGNISTIDWSSGVFFIKTETDPYALGGSNYSITGVTQMMSVPFSLYATNALTATNGLPSNPSTGAMAFFNGVSWENISTGMDDQVLTLQNGVPVWADNGGGSSVPPVVGDYYEGGIVFYILTPSDPGYVSGETHGLIVATSDISAGAEWGCYGTLLPGTNNTAIGGGASNTSSIIAGCSTLGIAAKLCDDLGLNGQGDWYLPNTTELSLIYNVKVTINNALQANGGSDLADDWYWSSNEAFNTNSFRINLTDNQNTIGSKSNDYRVRAIRSF